MPAVNTGTPALNQPSAIDAYTHWAAPVHEAAKRQARTQYAFYEHNPLFDGVSKRLKLRMPFAKSRRR